MSHISVGSEVKTSKWGGLSLGKGGAKAESNLGSTGKTDDSDGKPKHKMPQNKEVDLINMWKEVDMADEELERVRGLYDKKILECDQRWRKVQNNFL